jgi:Tfp pilus assembly protein PilO
MSEQVYFISMAALFGTPILIFGLKYWSAAQQARARIAEDGAYRKLASDAVTAQSGNAATLSAIQSELAEIKTRMASVETILKTVE